MSNTRRSVLVAGGLLTSAAVGGISTVGQLASSQSANAQSNAPSPDFDYQLADLVRRTKNSSCNLSSPMARLISFSAKNGIKTTNMTSPTTRMPFKLPPPMSGMLFEAVLPCHTRLAFLQRCKTTSVSLNISPTLTAMGKMKFMVQILRNVKHFAVSITFANAMR
jgi:hypothetical protein